MSPWTTITLVILISLLGFLGWLLLQTRQHQARLVGQLDEVHPPVAGHASVTVALEAERASLLDALKGEFAPAFNLNSLGGNQTTLTSLLAPAKPLLLVFGSPICGQCYEILPDLGGWQRVYGDRLAIALVSTGDAQSNLAMTTAYNIETVLLQRDQELIESYRLQQAPAAVLIDTDGRISAGPRYGTKAIRNLVATTLGLAMPTAPARDVQVVKRGEPVPALRRPALDGGIIDLATPTPLPRILLFWNPGCPHCRNLQPAILAFEQIEERPGLVLVARGPVDMIRGAGFSSPIVLDDDHSIASTFGAGGTPAAVLIDSNGIVASPVISGAGQIGTILSRLTTQTHTGVAA